MAVRQETGITGPVGAHPLVHFPASVGIGEWFNSHFIAARAGGSAKIPRSVVALNWVLSLLFIGGSRIGCRLWREYGTLRPSETRSVLIVGAGDAGVALSTSTALRVNSSKGQWPECWC